MALSVYQASLERLAPQKINATNLASATALAQAGQKLNPCLIQLGAMLATKNNRLKKQLSTTHQDILNKALTTFRSQHQAQLKLQLLFSPSNRSAYKQLLANAQQQGLTWANMFAEFHNALHAHTSLTEKSPVLMPKGKR